MIGKLQALAAIQTDGLLHRRLLAGRSTQLHNGFHLVGRLEQATEALVKMLESQLFAPDPCLKLPRRSVLN